MLNGVDVLIFDIQDIGVRFYTYESTMLYAMEEAAKAKIPFYVFDRPDPLTGLHVEGPMLDSPDCRSWALSRCPSGTASPSANWQDWRTANST